MAIAKTTPKKAAVTATVSKTAKKAAKRVGPKRAVSAYLFFSMDYRKQIIASKPDLAKKVTEISKLVGAKWGVMTAAEKAPYIAMYEDDKKRYEAEMKTGSAGA